MTKKRVEKPHRELTRRQLASWQKRRKRQRLIFSISTAVIVAVVGLLGVGWFISDFRPMQETIIVVNDREFDMSYYVDSIEYYSEGQSPEMLQYMLGYIEQGIQTNELVRQAAAELGITVSDKEAEQELKSRGLSINPASRDIVRVELLQQKMLDEYFDKQVPLAAEQRHVLAMLLESQSQAQEVRQRIRAGEDFGEIAGELSLNDHTREAKGDLGWQPRDMLTYWLDTSVVEDYAFSDEGGELSQALYDETIDKALGYWLVEVLERDESLASADIQVILLSSREEAEVVADRLQAGEDFAELVEEYSQDETSKEEGGNIEAVEPGTVGTAVDDFVFNPDVVPGTLSEPIMDETAYTTGGYWLVQVLEVDANREIAEDTRDILKSQLANEWVISLQDNPDNKVESFLNAEKRQWAYQRAVG